MPTLLPIDAPCLQPLQASFEYDQLESELKAVFLAVFESMIRPRERALNLYGMAHLGSEELVERNLKVDGLAVIRRDPDSMRFLLKTWRARNPKRGLMFLKKYLQTVWPNHWIVDQLWHPIAKLDRYPEFKAVNGGPLTHILTSRVRVSIPVSVDDGTGLASLQRALQATMAARLVLEAVLQVDISGAGISVANGAGIIAPLYIFGTLTI